MSTDLQPQQTPRSVGRPCSTCSHPQRAEIEHALVSRDILISTISSDSGVSIAALRRHRDHHMLVTGDDLAGAGLEGVALVVKLAEIAERLEDAAAAAEQAGRVSDMVRATDGQRRALEALLDHGVKHEETIARLDIADAVTKAVGRLARLRPDVAEAIAAELDASDRRAAAAELRVLIHEPRGLTR